LILQHNGTYRINGFAMEDPGLMKFVMAMKELPLYIYSMRKRALISKLRNGKGVMKNRAETPSYYTFTFYRLIFCLFFSFLSFSFG
jgi:hypothetical protein